eukprot:GHVR01151385.1.p1 GENE.GHVR01151385.1~~GHVR01151385.1.p1  ORF type:complete len:306 (+),score=42.52 GHVR01151385.1:580-1497(+)
MSDLNSKKYGCYFSCMNGIRIDVLPLIIRGKHYDGIYMIVSQFNMDRKHEDRILMNRLGTIFGRSASSIRISATALLEKYNGIDIMNNARFIVERMEMFIQAPMVIVTDGPTVTTISTTSDDNLLKSPGTVFVLKPDGVSVCVVISFSGVIHITNSKTTTGCKHYKRIGPLRGEGLYNKNQWKSLLSIVGGHLMEEMSDGVYVYLHTLCGYKFNEDQMEKLINESEWTPPMLKRSIYDDVDIALDSARRDKRCDGVIARIRGSRMRQTVDVMWSSSRSLFITESDKGRNQGNTDRRGMTLGSSIL